METRGLRSLPSYKGPRNPHIWHMIFNCKYCRFDVFDGTKFYTGSNRHLHARFHFLCPSRNEGREIRKRMRETRIENDHKLGPLHLSCQLLRRYRYRRHDPCSTPVTLLREPRAWIPPRDVCLRKPSSSYTGVEQQDSKTTRCIDVRACKGRGGQRGDKW